MSPDLKSFDLVLLNSSGGKDSAAMMARVVELAREAGVMERLRVVHADLGRAEWKGTTDVVVAHAAHYGLPLTIVSREKNDLLEHVEDRGKWPSSAARYCTSDHKRGPLLKLMTRFVREERERNGGRRVRVLNVMGIRAEESSARAKKNPYALDERASNGRREVWTWFPIFEWKEDEVWARVKAEGLAVHRAYGLGMPRLSCAFCIFATPDLLKLAGRENPELLDEYARVEEKIGHTFRKDCSIAAIRDELRSERPAERQLEMFAA
jgi:3'-phosphoadenosine 5'-phosphosulfate sulfotransferase (PAPS reductase)/FAD synthetase